MYVRKQIIMNLKKTDLRALGERVCVTATQVRSRVCSVLIPRLAVEISLFLYLTRVQLLPASPQSVSANKSIKQEGNKKEEPVTTPTCKAYAPTVTRAPCIPSRFLGYRDMHTHTSPTSCRWWWERFIVRRNWLVSKMNEPHFSPPASSVWKM